MPGSNDPTLDFYNSLMSDDIKKAISTPAAQTAVGEGELPPLDVTREDQERAQVDPPSCLCMRDGVKITFSANAVIVSRTRQLCEANRLKDFFAKRSVELAAFVEEKMKLVDEAIAQRDDRDRHIELAYSALGDVNRSIYLFDHIQKLIAQRDEAKKIVEKWNRLPGDWFADSSLETWFPLSAELLKRYQIAAEAAEAKLAALDRVLGDEELEKLFREWWSATSLSKARSQTAYEDVAWRAWKACASRLRSQDGNQEGQ